jgi:DNA-binding transcriptional regulator/RsmH inhibitor MraZ
MSRRSALDGTCPWICWPVTVGSKNRLRLPDGVPAVVDWLRLLEKPTTVLAGRGVRGGLRLYPPSRRERIAAAIKDVAGAAPTAGAETVDAARWLGMTWKISVEADGRFVLPETPRKLGLAPSALQAGVIIAYGDTLEVWTREGLDKYFAEHGAELDQLVETLAEDLL